MIVKKLFPILLACVVAAQGCTSLGLGSLWGAKTFVADARHPVTEVMCLWEAAEGTGLDGLPTRGFAGQVLFFTAGKPSPAKVDGDIRVFVFDDKGVNGDRSIPLHQFDFPGPAWNAFLTTTNFGTAYQLFIPYTRSGGMHADCEIRVRYTPKGGNPVYSRPCTVPLAGPREGQAARSRSTRQGIQQASYEEPAQNGLTPVPVPSEIRLSPTPASIGARDAKVERLNRLATALADDAQSDAREADPASTTPRRRLNPLAAESALAPMAEPAATVEIPSESRHVLLD